MQPLVSIVMTSYNHEAYLRQAIDSVVLQKTDFLFELIIHDDASSDSSADIIRAYATKYPDVIVPILQTENQFSRGNGAVGRSIEGHIRGKYRAYCEGDDFWIDPLKLQRQVDYMEANPDCVAVYGNCVIVDYAGVPSADLAKSKSCYVQWPERDMTLAEFAKNGVFPGQTATKLLRSSLYEEMLPEVERDYFSMRQNGDMKSLVLALCVGRVHIQPEVTVAHRVVFDFGDSWTARSKGRNLFGNAWGGGVDLKRFCHYHFNENYPNDWSLFRSAQKALEIARKDPTEENIAQSRIVRNGFRNAANMYVHILLWAAKGLPYALARKAKGALFGNPHLSAGMVGYECIEWPPSAACADYAEGEVHQGLHNVH